MLDSVFVTLLVAFKSLKLRHNFHLFEYLIYGNAINIPLAEQDTEFYALDLSSF
ncbi:hypothetical protein ymoll0001_11020 [Yersinia mollaretii ATCC 43969]|uniref:Uncharacterized protein n=1 Tax=Yersinia mollaretii (strain ATCC 43969 / DSM 18520 / CIP 103324 / CNY 7263 / WAIP 204) TaxID=349967 RepID=A0ABM9YEY0_YERMW|nr:hypothetical protein ymoll0001_11020 [Yersinia mollaretii ATCC 43969]